MQFLTSNLSANFKNRHLNEYLRHHNEYIKYITKKSDKKESHNEFLVWHDSSC